MEHLRISTMTGIGELNTSINLTNLFNNIRPNNLIRYVETNFGKKGYAKKNDKKKRKITGKRNLFFNQGTLIIFYDNKLINIKLFSNKLAKIQMTGLKNESQGINVINKIIDYIKDLDTNFFKENKVFNNYDAKLNYFKIALINSDYDFGFNINRETVFNDILEKNYYTTYSPDSYPGVNSKYYWNTINNEGICKCDNICDGKGNGNGDGQCRRVTMAIFQSGKMIITGAQQMQQVEDSFNFINNFVLKNKDKYILR
jgi:TATA-box binding protein (TBP) (component of TFIID and TFIIIB)